MKEHITPEQTLEFYKELDDAHLFDQLNYLDSLWEPTVGRMIATELWRKKKPPLVISKVLSDSKRFVCYSPRTETNKTYYKGDAIPLFSVGQLINILGVVEIKYIEGLWVVSNNNLKFAEHFLCDALWGAFKDKVRRYAKNNSV